jgi:hypothetical protein
MLRLPDRPKDFHSVAWLSLPILDNARLAQGTGNLLTPQKTL